MQQGKFLVIDGLDGTGKTMALRLLWGLLEGLGIPNNVTREPGGTPYAERIRDLIFNEGRRGDEQIHGMTENCMFWAARAQHVFTRIIPEMNAGKVIISDRFSDVTYAYQGGGRGIGLEKVRQFEKLVLGDFRPDAIAIFTGDPEILKKRVGGRKDNNRLDEEPDEFYLQAHDIFLSRAAAEPARYVLIDGDREVLFTFGQLLGWLDRLKIINLSDHDANEHVLNTALSAFWETWQRDTEWFSRYRRDNWVGDSNDQEKKKEEISRIKESGQLPGYIWENVDALDCPMFDMIGATTTLIEGVEHFHKRNGEPFPSQDEFEMVPL